MRILVTNDDGISAPGLSAAEDIATELAGPDGEVWTIAPAFEQSGVSHSISYVRPMRIQKLGPRRYAVEGSPADCVLAGLFDILIDTPPDLVLSGVNQGYNVAEDTLYSGTIGAAMEGALQKVRAIAMSQYFGRENVELDDPFAPARAKGAEICRRLLEDAPWHDAHYEVFYNINFPSVSPERIKGVRTTIQGHRPHPTFSAVPQTAPNSRRYLWLGHGPGNEKTEPGSDAFETMHGWATVTPLRADLTAREVVEPLEKIFG
jgi:5'/3'-nucleotidase